MAYSEEGVCSRKLFYIIAINNPWLTGSMENEIQHMCRMYKYIHRRILTQSSAYSTKYIQCVEEIVCISAVLIRMNGNIYDRDAISTAHLIRSEKPTHAPGTVRLLEFISSFADAKRSFHNYLYLCLVWFYHIAIDMGTTGCPRKEPAATSPTHINRKSCAYGIAQQYVKP